MTFLFRLLVLVLIVSLVRHIVAFFLAGSRKWTTGRPQRQASPQGPATITGTMVKDPQCGTYTALELAVTANLAGKPLHFCSRECRDKYLLAATAEARVAR